MKAIFWPYKYKDMMETWRKQMIWLANALSYYKVEVKQHPQFICRGLSIPIYDSKIDNPADICIYNHTDLSNIRGNVLKTKVNWFFKPTVPDEIHATLDELGYGPYSSITYQKPNFENIDMNLVNSFFNTQVKSWIETKITKWKGAFENNILEVNDNNYILILGQCSGDEVVTRHDFGDYCNKLEVIVRECIFVSNKKVIVKLHPYMDGEFATTTTISDNMKKRLEQIDKRVSVFTGKINVHNFIKNADAVILGNSGAGWEAMMHHKPIISWGHPEYKWVSYDLLHLADLHRALKLEWFNVENQDRYLYWYENLYCFFDPGSAIRRVGELLKNLETK